MRTLIDFAIENHKKPLSHKPSETSNEKQIETPNLNFFNCQKLCKNYDKCRRDMNTSQNMLDEIETAECYETKFPFFNPYTHKPTCPCQEWTSHPDDPNNPYPKCNAKQTDVPFQLPKDRIIRNPDLCWTCVMARSKKRKEAYEKKQLKKYIKPYDPYKGEPRVNWGKSEGFDMFELGDR